MALKFLNDGFFDGKVGIGTNSPSAKLEITGSTSTAGDTTLHLRLPVGNVTAGTTEMGNILFSSTDSSFRGSGSIAKISTIAGNGFNAWTGAGRPTDLAFFTQPLGAAAELVEAMRINQDGNVGIGTDNPNAKLHIGPSTLVSGYTPTTTTLAVSDEVNGAELLLRGKSPRIWFDSTAAGNAEIYLDGTKLNILSDFPSAPGESRLYIKADGNVGIGTDDPNAKLHIDNGGASTTTVRMDAGASYGAIVAYGNNGNKYFELGEVGASDPGRLSLFESGVSKIQLATNADSYFNGGNVGIGITSPTKTLNVEFDSNSVAPETGEGLAGGIAGTGVLLRNSNETVGTFANLDFRANNTDARIAVTHNATNNGDFHFIIDKAGSTAQTRLFIEGETGNVGIGTTNPDTKLKVENNLAGMPSANFTTTVANSTLHLSAETAPLYNHLLMGVGSPESSWIQSQHGNSNAKDLLLNPIGGNVGIGNTNPSDYSADANNLVVGSLIGNNGITILSTSSSGYGSIYFADSTTGNKVYSGFIRYQQNQSNMTFGTNEAERMRIASNGDFDFKSGDATFGGDVMVNRSGSDSSRINLFATGTGNAIIILDAMNGDALGDNYGSIAQLNTGELEYNIRPNSPNPIHKFIGNATFAGNVTTGASLISTNAIVDNVVVKTANGNLTFKTNGGSTIAQFYNNLNATFIGNVGIGTTNPAAKLQVGENTSGLTGTTSIFQEGGAEVGLYVKARVNRASLLVADNDTGVYISAEGGKGSFGRTQGVSTANINIDGTGNVGIGTTNPAAKLDITETTAETNTLKDVLRLSHVTSGTAASGLGAGILFSAERALNGVNLSRGAIYGVSGTNTNDDGVLAFHTRTNTAGDSATTGMNEKMRINSIGNVGIGETNPTAKLHVKGGDIQTTDTTGANGVLRIRSTTTGTPSYGYPNVGAGDVVIEGGGTTQRQPGVITLINDDSSISANQNLGVIQFVGKDDAANGYASSQIIGTSNNGASSGNSGGGILKFLTSQGSTISEKMRIAADGKVGIGVTSLTAPLQVAGIAEYTNNTTALAAGLTAGAFYRTGDLLKVVH